MLSNEENIPNNDTQSEEVLNHENAPKKDTQFALWKRGVLIAIGTMGLFAASLFATFFCLGVPSFEREGAISLVTYVLLAGGLVGFISVDIPKFLPAFKKWQPYVVGLGLGIGMILFDMAYLNLIDLFYTTSVGGNETSVRSVIDLYPAACMFIFGILGPLCEELTYRVGLFGLLKKVSRVLAYIVASLVFGFMHFDWTSSDLVNELVILPTYVVSGAILALAYDLYDLPCSWMAHSVNNVWAVFMNILTKYYG